jgi:hypothetical protein
VERVEGLHPPDLVRVEEALAERRHPEIDDCQSKRIAAEAATRCIDGRRGPALFPW